jgi:hypothetical protein
MARIFWVAAESWSALRNAEWEGLLRAAHEITFNKLPPRTRAVLEMPVKAREKLIRERRTLLTKRTAAEKSAKASKKKAAKKR